MRGALVWVIIISLKAAAAAAGAGACAAAGGAPRRSRQPRGRAPVRQGPRRGRAGSQRRATTAMQPVSITDTFSCSLATEGGSNSLPNSLLALCDERGPGCRTNAEARRGNAHLEGVAKLLQQRGRQAEHCASEQPVACQARDAVRYQEAACSENCASDQVLRLVRREPAICFQTSLPQ